MKFTAPIAMPTPKTMPGEEALRTAFAKGEGDAADDDRAQAEAARDRDRVKAGHQHVDGVFPG